MRLTVVSCFNDLLAADIIHASLLKSGKQLHQYEAAFIGSILLLVTLKIQYKGHIMQLVKNRFLVILVNFGEFCIRFNYRFRVKDIFNTLIKCGAKSPPMPEKLLALVESRWKSGTGGLQNALFEV